MNVLSRACPSHNVQAQEASPPSQSELRNPLGLTMKRIFFLRKKKNASSGGLRLTPKLQQDPASGAQHAKSRCSTGTSKFHQTVETQHCEEQTVNLFIIVWTQYHQDFISIFQIQRFCNFDMGLTPELPWAAGLSSSCCSKRISTGSALPKGQETMVTWQQWQGRYLCFLHWFPSSILHKKKKILALNSDNKETI